MKTKLWSKYLFYIVFILLVVFLRQTHGIMTFTNKDFSTNYFSVVVSSILGVCIGLILGLEHLVMEIRKQGNWKVNFSKLIIAGLPSLYLALANIITYSGLPFLQNTLGYPFLYLSTNFTVGYVNYFQLILGYIIITSCYKN